MKKQTIVDTIRAEQKKARLLRDQGKFRAGILTVLLAEVSIVGKNAQRETTDEEAQTVITKFLKNLKETFKIYTGVTIDEITSSQLGSEPTEQKAKSMLAEAEIYKEFLPNQMTSEELREEVKLVIRHYGAPKMGQVMGHFSKNFRGRYDGRVLSEIVQEMLGK